MKFREVLTVAHDLDVSERSSDVTISEALDFSALLLSNQVLEGLKRAGFKRPSPIQLKAIPVAKLGLDVVVQAKSGTGKTCVFAVLALESVFALNSSPQVLVIAPTREISDQIFQCILAIGSPLRQEGLKVGLFIGGKNIQEDYQRLKSGCQIVVGTPGRLCQLVQRGALQLDTIRLLVLDEADKLMEESYQQNINWLFSQLPEHKQLAVFSATFPQELDQFLSQYMLTPTMVKLDAENVQLVGIKQYLTVVPFQAYEKDISKQITSAKVERLCQILDRLNYTQCLVFCNFQDRCESVCQTLKDRKYDAQYISGTLSQSERSKVMKQLKRFRCRVLVSTDLTARGIDAQNVNLVVNLDVPIEIETYLHRIGRAGRFGGYGAAITICTVGADDKKFYAIGSSAKLQIKSLSLTEEKDPFPSDLCTNEAYWKRKELLDLQGLYESAMAQSRRRVDQNNKGTANGEVVFYGKPKHGFQDPKPDKHRVSPENFAMPIELLPRETNSFGRPYSRQEMVALGPHRHQDLRQVLPNPDRGRVNAENFKMNIDPLHEESRKMLSKPYSREQIMSFGQKKSLPVPTAQSRVHAERWNLQFELLDPELRNRLARPYVRDEMLAMMPGTVSNDLEPPIPRQQSPAPVEAPKIATVPQKLVTKELAKISSTSVFEPLTLFGLGAEVHYGTPSPPQDNHSPPRLVYSKSALKKLRKKLTPTQWEIYATSKWDLSQPPFVETPRTRNDNRVWRNIYNRKMMVRVQRCVTRDKWMEYAGSKWDLSQEPFVADPNMRTTYSNQVRLSKSKHYAEKYLRKLSAQKEAKLNSEERDEQKEDEGEKPKQAELKISPSMETRIIQTPQQFFASISSDLRKFLSEKETASPTHPGPLVADRLMSAQWSSKVMNSAEVLSSKESDFYAKVKPEMNTEPAPVPTISPEREIEAPMPGRRVVKYDRDAILDVWSEVVNLQLNARESPWFNRVYRVGIFVSRSFAVRSEQRQLELVHVEKEECATQTESNEVEPHVKVSQKVDQISQASPVCVEEAGVQTEEWISNDCKHEAYERQLTEYYKQLDAWVKENNHVLKAKQMYDYLALMREE